MYMWVEWAGNYFLLDSSFCGLMDDGEEGVEMSNSRMNNEPEVVSEVNNFFLPAPPQVKPLVDPPSKFFLSSSVIYERWISGLI